MAELTEKERSFWGKVFLIGLLLTILGLIAIWIV